MGRRSPVVTRTPQTTVSAVFCGFSACGKPTGGRYLWNRRLGADPMKQATVSNSKGECAVASDNRPVY